MWNFLEQAMALLREVGAMASPDFMTLQQMTTDGLAWPEHETNASESWFRPFVGISDMQDMRPLCTAWTVLAYHAWVHQIRIGTRAQLSSLLTELESNSKSYGPTAASASPEGQRMQRRSSALEGTGDGLETAASLLTDVALGAASTALRQSETRNQMALDTISCAISAYGNWAGGLLGNVQRTQRGVLA